MVWPIFPGNIPSVVLPDIPTTNLEFWVKADAGITKDGSDNVTAWADQSGNSRDLGIGTSPLWVDAQANGNPVVRFDGSNDQMYSTAFTVAMPWHIFTVVKMISWGLQTSIIGKRESGGSTVWPQTMRNSSPTIGVASGGSVIENSNLSVGSFGLVQTLGNTTSSFVKINDGTGSSGSLTSNSLSGVCLGAYGGSDSPSGFGNIEIAEVLIYSSEQTGTALTDIKDHLNGKYNLY